MIYLFAVFAYVYI